MIIPLIFFLFLIPGVVYGYASGVFKSHKDVIQGDEQSHEHHGLLHGDGLLRGACSPTPFAQSNLGALIALKGAAFLKALGLPGPVTIIGIIGLSASRQPAGRLGLGQVGPARADLRADPDAGGPFAGADPGRLPRRGFDHQHRDAVDAVLPARRRLLRSLPEVDGHRDGRFDDDSLLGQPALSSGRASSLCTGCSGFHSGSRLPYTYP